MFLSKGTLFNITDSLILHMWSAALKCMPEWNLANQVFFIRHITDFLCLEILDRQHLSTMLEGYFKQQNQQKQKNVLSNRLWKGQFTYESRNGHTASHQYPSPPPQVFNYQSSIPQWLLFVSRSLQYRLSNGDYFYHPSALTI